ncbi:sensor histidine kinase [Flavobacterium paronense]|uniref:Sensor histidine kinase n=1 Tax=Flavobacterium paronense TaxID=1392775 RepID=A0ABV5GAG8_9FLAO|nr:sensor histidine kinase [Flavobacterium paronense]MDN3677456.1 sensor histidine kinase [Flavobacterium paronense]
MGFVWITGNDAVNRYDGNYVKVYKKDQYFENCKNLQQGYGFAEDDSHNIYIGSTTGLYVYVRRKDRFNVKFLFPKGKDQTVFSIGFANGKVWCHNKDFDIIAYDIKSNTAKFYNTSSSYKVASFHVYDNSQNPIFTRIPFIDANDNLWILNPNGLLFFDTKTKKSHRYLEKYLTDNEFKIISSSYDKYTNTILIGTNTYLLLFDCNSRSIFKKNEYNTRIEGIAVNKSIIVVKDKERFDIYKKDFEKIYNQKLNENFATTYCYSFDKMNRLWMCRDGFGQMILDFNPPLLNKVSSTNELFKSGVGNFSEFTDGSFLVQDNVVFDKEERHLKKINANVNPALIIKEVTDLKHKIIWQLVQNNDLTIDLFQIDENKQLKFYGTLSNIQQIGLLQDIVLLENQLVCSFQSGLYIIDTKEKKLNKLANQTKKNPFKINPISKNRIVVSYLNQEATLYQLNESYNIVHSQNILNGLQPFYFQEDTNKNRVWVGTNNGILVLNSNFKIIKKIDANNNLSGTYIYGILLDEKGNCWASHQRGLSYINGDNYNIINFTKEDGIQDWDFNNRAYYKSTDGTLFFGGMKGFNYFKPPLKYDNAIYKSKVYIDEILVNQEKLHSNTNNDFIRKLNLDYNQNNITIHAIVCNIYKGKQSPIVYRINNNKWIYKNSDCTIDLANLAPDTYKLELGVYDKFQNKVIIQKTITIAIDFPIYKKVWFWLLILGYALVVILYLVYRRRLAKQEIEFKQQLALEQQRNKITADLHDDIGATLSSLQINSAVANRLITKNPEEAQLILNKIEDQSQNIADKIGDIIWSMKPGKDEFMSISTRIKNFANDILGATTIEYEIKIDTSIDTIIKDISTRKNIVLIIKEAINNSVKYSKATKVQISLSIIENNIVLELKDNGIGFDTNQIKGNGMTNMRKRVEELNGKFKVNSTINNGTTIKALIPLSLN